MSQKQSKIHHLCADISVYNVTETGRFVICEQSYIYNVTETERHRKKSKIHRLHFEDYDTLWGGGGGETRLHPRKGGGGGERERERCG